MSDQPPKEAAPDPEIPDELKSKLSRPKRPANYRPISGDEGDNPPEEKVENKLRDVRPFFKKLAAVMKTARWQMVGKKKVQVLDVGEDGLPFVISGISAEVTREMRAKLYLGSPKMSPTHGDITPEFVEWLYLNHPYDAAVRYFGRSTHVHVNPH